MLKRAYLMHPFHKASTYYLKLLGKQLIKIYLVDTDTI